MKLTWTKLIAGLFLMIFLTGIVSVEVPSLSVTFAVMSMVYAFILALMYINKWRSE